MAEQDSICHRTTAWSLGFLLAMKLRIQFLLVAFVVALLGAMVFWCGQLPGLGSLPIDFRRAGWWLLVLAGLPFLVWIAYVIADALMGIFIFIGRKKRVASSDGCGRQSLASVEKNDENSTRCSCSRARFEDGPG